MTITAIVLIAVTKSSTIVMIARVPRNVVKMVRLASSAQSNFVALSEGATHMATHMVTHMGTHMDPPATHMDDCYWINIHMAMVVREEQSPQKQCLEPDPCLEILTLV